MNVPEVTLHTKQSNLPAIDSHLHVSDSCHSERKNGNREMSHQTVLMLVFLGHLNLTVSYFRLYHTEYPLKNGDHHCLYHYASTYNRLGQHLVPYCIRSK